MVRVAFAHPVEGLAEGDLVIAPFIYSDGACPHCRNGSTISCAAGGIFGDGEIDGGQGEAVRVPLAGSTLVPVPGSGHSDQMLKSLLSLSDVMSTGHHAEVCGGEAGATWSPWSETVPSTPPWTSAEP